MLTVAQCSTSRHSVASGDTIGLLQLWERLRAQRRMRLLCSVRLSRAAIGLSTSARPVLLLVARILTTVLWRSGDGVSVCWFWN